MSRGKFALIIAVSIMLIAVIAGRLIVACTPVREATSSNLTPAPPVFSPMGSFGGIETMDDQTREILRQRFANITVVPSDTMLKIYSRLHSEGIFPRPPSLNYSQDNGILIIAMTAYPQRPINIPVDQDVIGVNKEYLERIMLETLKILRADGIHLDIALPSYSRVILDSTSQPNRYGGTLLIGTMYYHAENDTSEWILNENPEYK